MNTLSLTDVVKSIRDLPALPAVVMELLGGLNQEDISTQKLGEKIAQDQALSAKTLRLANSSFYGMARKVISIQQAIAVLGFNSVRTLVTAAAVIDNFSSHGKYAFDLKVFWRQSIATALCAKLIARILKMNEDHAFMAGLLHDIGILVLVTTSPARYADVLAYQHKQDCTALEAESTLLGVDHTMVGRMLAEHWKFPVAIQQAIERHHANTFDIYQLASLIALSDAISYGLGLSEDENAKVPLLPQKVWDNVNLSSTVLQSIFRETENQFEEVCKILVS